MGGKGEMSTLGDYFTKEGLKSARARGRKGGRPRVKERDIKKAMNRYHTGEYSVKEIVEMTSINRATLYRYLNASQIHNHTH